MSIPSAASYKTFKFLREVEIPALKIVVQEYEHEKTGAKHIHYAADNPENVFCVALRTVPMDDTGVAHILEHTVLCGSEKYPVRDPFFMMIRRSNNSFMNAMTSSDWTAYPFASYTPKDFDNLLGVYLDAVFFPRISEIDFRQEGWRLDVEDEKLVYKGVVYNEMKGAMSDSSRRVMQDLDNHLYSTTTYHYNSGGEPCAIPDLTYGQFKAFHETYYHPSNATFFTYGDRTAESLQETFEKEVLHRFDALGETITIEREKPFTEPKYVETTYPNDEVEEKDYVVLGWLVGDNTDILATYRLKLLERVLLEDSSSPLLKALETTKLGKAPYPYSGMSDRTRDMEFIAGLEGTKAENAEEVEKLILSTLEAVAENGVDQERLKALLHQMEIESRDLETGSYPLGLKMILESMSSAVHRTDVVAALDVAPYLEQLHKDIQDENFIPNLIRQTFLENPHRVTITAKADSKAAGEDQAKEQARLAEIQAGMSSGDIESVRQLNADLDARQQMKEDESCLPKITLADLPDSIHVEQGVKKQLEGLEATVYAQGTNDLVYQTIVVDLPELDERQTQLLPMMANIMGALGAGDMSYEEVSQQETKVSSGVYGGTSFMTKLGEVDHVRGFFSFSGSALSCNRDELTSLMALMFEKVRFDELSRIKELIQQSALGVERAVGDAGHALAMRAARSDFAVDDALQHKLSGLARVQFIKKLAQDVEDEAKLKELAQEFTDLHQKILAAPRQILAVSEEQFLDDLVHSLNEKLGSKAGEVTSFKAPAVQGEAVQQMWVTNTDVNFCAKAWNAVPSTHEDGPALKVLGQFLRDGYLHRVVREKGGAYGGGANFEADTGTFAMFSYRDPRIEGTLEDFDGAVKWLLENEHEAEALEQAIIGIVSTIDSPKTPASSAKSSFWSDLHGRTKEKREDFRSRVLKVTLDDLHRVAEKYLKDGNSATAVITNAAEADRLKDFGLERIDL